MVITNSISLSSTRAQIAKGKADQVGSDPTSRWSALRFQSWTVVCHLLVCVFLQCSLTCGLGFQSRSVTCVSGGGGAQVGVSNCREQKPEERKGCINAVCQCKSNQLRRRSFDVWRLLQDYINQLLNLTFYYFVPCLHLFAYSLHLTENETKPVLENSLNLCKTIFAFFWVNYARTHVKVFSPIRHPSKNYSVFEINISRYTISTTITFFIFKQPIQIKF